MDGVEWSASCLAALILAKGPRVTSFYKRLEGALNRSGRCETVKNFDLPLIEAWLSSPWHTAIPTELSSLYIQY
jgi:hypothetical protein